MKNTILSLLSMIFIFNINSQNSQEFTINAGNYYYSPSSLTINVGDVVNWYNDGGFHNVNFDINSITSESFGNPESFSSSATSEVGALIYSHVFNTPGTYTYDCSIGSHAANGMVGTIVVESAPEPTLTTVSIGGGEYLSETYFSITSGCEQIFDSYSPEILLSVAGGYNDTYNDPDNYSTGPWEIALPESYIVKMYDTYGDGWNGNVLVIGDTEYTGPSSALQPYESVVEYVGCGVVGCTDVNACNYDASLGAITDDGSCTYPASAELDCDGNCTSGIYTTVNVQEVSSSGYFYSLTDWSGTWSLVSSDGTVLTTDGDNFVGCLSDDCYTISGISGSSGYSFAYSLNGGSYVTPGNADETGTDLFTTGAGSCGVFGCTDVDACNYDASLGATIDDGSCEYPNSTEFDCDGNCISGGTPLYVNVWEQSEGGYLYSLTQYGGSWSLVSSDGTALTTDGDNFVGCVADDCYTISGISGSSGYSFTYILNYDYYITPGNINETGTDSFTIGEGTYSIGPCDVAGCMDVNACNYDADLGVTVDDGSCTYPVDACTDCAGADLGGQDCAGVCGGTSVVDECGECGGDGSSCAVSSILMITEIADPQNSSSAGRFVEIFNSSSDDIDLSEGYALQRWTNGSSDPQTAVQLTGTIVAGGFYIVCNNAGDFLETYGFDADQDVGTGGVADSNGDDNLALLAPDGTVIDMFGVPGEDGTGTSHEFEDGRAARACETTASSTWSADDWVIDNDSGGGDGPQYAPEDFDPYVWCGIDAQPYVEDPCADVTCADGEICEEGTCIAVYSLTVSVDMTLEGFDGESMDVRLDGGPWNAMTDMGDGVWSYTFTGLPAGLYEYNFNDAVGNGYESGSDLDACAGGQYGNNRTATIVDSDVVVDTVCWESCDACPSDPCANVTCVDGEICEEGICLPTYSLTVSVDMSIEGFDGEAMEVRLVDGDWMTMTSDSDGIWSYTFTGLTAGDYEYNFFDGWYESSSNLDACAGGQYGNNRTATIVDSDLVVDTVCWESCDACQCEDLDGDSICDNVDDCVGTLDCLGVCNGTAALDCLGECGGSAVFDDCGVCGGENACADCAGTPNGPAVFDECGVCNGSGPDEGFDCDGNSLLDTQTIELPEGWSLWSTYIDVSDSSMEELMSNIVDNVTIIKNSNGNVYWPEFELNNINSIDVGEGFQAKMITSENLDVTGYSVSMDTQFTIPGGWSIIGYLSENSMLPQTAMTDGWVQISSENLVILKDEVGNVYWPEFGLNNIGYMQAGEGYQIKTNATANFSFTYSDNGRFAESTQIEKNVFYDNPINTGNNMTVGIPVDAWEIMPAIGDEISAYDESGMLIGSTKYAGDNIALTLWGDDLTTSDKDGLAVGEKFTFKLWNSDINTESELVVTKWDVGSDEYSIDAINIVSNIVISNSSASNSYKLYQNVPNPFNGTTTVKFYVPENSEVNIGIYNMLGEYVAEITNENYISGEHEVLFNSNDLGQGTYFIRMNTDNFTSTKQMNIVK